MSTFSLIKETTGGATVIANGEERFFSPATPATLSVRGNIVELSIGRFTFPLATTDTININSGSGSSVFSGTVAQLKSAIIPVFPKANTGTGGPGTSDFTAGEISILKGLAGVNNPSNI